MTVGILQLILFIPESNSLKEKRMVLHKFKARLRNSFNVAISQVADSDKWQKATLAIVGVERTKKAINSILSQVVHYTEHCGYVQVIDYQLELL